MIRAYVAPTEQPAIWIEDPAEVSVIELTLDESADLREQMHYAEATARLTCEVGDCRSHQVGGGACLTHGGAS